MIGKTYGRTLLACILIVFSSNLFINTVLAAVVKNIEFQTFTFNKFIIDFNSDSLSPTVDSFYVIAGSFLNPANARRQIAIMKKLGFIDCQKHIFPDSEFHSVVVAVFPMEKEALELEQLIRLRNQAAFVKKISYPY
ncbi:MAG: SPOR domain-containing protein [Bacteroidota bacterium]|nr:SPOR domain-containing protein [Bacteroidota bacterium]